MPIDPVALTAKLVRCASVTPADAGALAVLEDVLKPAGFECHRVRRGGIENLFARWGAPGEPRTFGFNGHTDVVPVGDEAAWTYPPFGAEIDQGKLWGRGATDMKSGVAAFVAAAVDYVTLNQPKGSLIITITGDDEGDAKDGTTDILDWMSERQERMSVCLVGEPTCPNHMGEAIKIGRRGSMNLRITARGIQGHSAYPHRARNPVSAMARLVDRLSCYRLDDGTAHFDPSSVAVTTIDTGNTATNVIPAHCQAGVNIRFNDAHSSLDISTWVADEIAAIAQDTGVVFETETKVSGESFLTPPGELSDLVSAAVEAETGTKPVLSTSGGTSDARFVKDHCPVVEFGLVGKTMHEVDEHVDVGQVRQLKSIYKRILGAYFA